MVPARMMRRRATGSPDRLRQHSQHRHRLLPRRRDTDFFVCNKQESRPAQCWGRSPQHREFFQNKFCPDLVWAWSQCAAVDGLFIWSELQSTSWAGWCQHWPGEADVIPQGVAQLVPGPVRCHAAADLEKQRDTETSVQVHRSVLISQLVTKVEQGSHSQARDKTCWRANYYFSITTQTSLGSVDKKSRFHPK